MFCNTIGACSGESNMKKEKHQSKHFQNSADILNLCPIPS